MDYAKKHVFICAKKKPEGIPNCKEAGGMDLTDAVRAALFKAGRENEVLVATSGCVGLCTKGPNMIVYPEGKWYTSVRLDEVETIVQQHLLGGVPVERPEDPDGESIAGQLVEHHGRVKQMMQDAGKL